MDDDIENISKLLFHEFGHYCVDLIIIDKIEGLTISEIVIRNYSCENVKWCGYVKMIPEDLLKLETVLGKHGLLVFKQISLVSGCLFQTIATKDKLSFKDCFSFKKNSIGKGDHDTFWEIPFLLRKKYTKMELNKNEYYKNLNKLLFVEYATDLKKIGIIEELKDFILTESIKIHKEFLKQKCPKEFSYKYEGDDLNNLHSTIDKIISAKNFDDLVLGIHANILKELQKAIN